MAAQGPSRTQTIIPTEAGTWLPKAPSLYLLEGKGVPKTGPHIFSGLQ